MAVGGGCASRHCVRIIVGTAGGGGGFLAAARPVGGGRGGGDGAGAGPSIGDSVGGGSLLPLQHPLQGRRGVLIFSSMPESLASILSSTPSWRLSLLVAAIAIPERPARPAPGSHRVCSPPRRVRCPTPRSSWPHRWQLTCKHSLSRLPPSCSAGESLPGTSPFRRPTSACPRRASGQGSLSGVRASCSCKDGRWCG